jgi:hypothetical protein
VVVVADVLPCGLGVVAFEGRPQKLFVFAAGHFDPEALRGGDVGAFVDLQAESEVAPRDPCSIEEAEEEQDQPRIAVGKDHPVATGVWLGLRTLAPIGDGAGDDDLPVAEPADFGCGGVALIRTVRCANFALPRPVLAGSLRCALSYLLGTESLRGLLIGPRIALISRLDLPPRRRAIARSRKRSSSSLVLILEF